MKYSCTTGRDGPKPHPIINENTEIQSNACAGFGGTSAVAAVHDKPHGPTASQLNLHLAEDCVISYVHTYP